MVDNLTNGIQTVFNRVKEVMDNSFKQIDEVGENFF